MTVERRFLIASSLARLLRKGGHPERVVEGYLPSSSSWIHFVAIEGSGCQLVLHPQDKSQAQDGAPIPRRHAEALLEICAGKIGYERTPVRVANCRRAVLDHILVPGRCDLLRIEFEDLASSRTFSLPSWFGPEITDEPSYEKYAIALNGAPAQELEMIKNEGLEASLNLLEGRAADLQPGEPSRRTEELASHETVRIAVSSAAVLGNQSSQRPIKERDGHPLSAVAALAEAVHAPVTRVAERDGARKPLEAESNWNSLRTSPRLALSRANPIADRQQGGWSSSEKVTH